MEKRKTKRATTLANSIKGF
ncbi:hypothetical protein CCACVL1_02669 [Corchorus capsularis]|uniref:Uncharacterized protein n=1 Tax=Corchorus capsularis TaxID=210143 RepID=A0A1R3K708_COCAP|nr:hypothetical protein CCACVL1_02669 [Corchorus capsularis]